LEHKGRGTALRPFLGLNRVLFLGFARHHFVHTVAKEPGVARVTIRSFEVFNVRLVITLDIHKIE
jgi:hypothetical protein